MLDLFFFPNCLFCLGYLDTWPMLSELCQAFYFCTVTKGVVLVLDYKYQLREIPAHIMGGGDTAFPLHSLLLQSRKSQYCCLSKECDSPVLFPDFGVLVHQQGCVKISRLMLNSKTQNPLAFCPKAPCHVHMSWEHKGLLEQFLNHKWAWCTSLLTTAFVQVSELVSVHTLGWYCLKNACKNEADLWKKIVPGRASFTLASCCWRASV